MPHRRGAPIQEETPTDRLLSLLAALAGAVLVVLVPLVWDTDALDAFRGPKTAVALAAWCVLAAIFVARNIGGRAWLEPWLAAWGGVLAGGAVSALGCAEPGRALAGLVPLALAAVGWGALRQLSESRRGALAALVVCAGTLEAFLVFLFLRVDWRPESFALFEGARGRYAWIGTMGNPADAAILLVLPTLLAARRAISKGHRSIPYGAAAALMAAAIVGTRTLTAIAALAAGAAVLLWRFVPRKRRLPVVATAAVLVVAALVAPPLGTRVRAALTEVRGGGLMWAGSGRAAGFAAAASMLAARPATGVGFDLFEANSFRFQSEDALAERGRILGLVTGFGEAHNDILQYAAETGLAGVTLALLGIGWAVWRGRRGGGIVSGAPLLAAAAALALVQFPLHLAAVAAQWAVLAALALAPLPPPPPGGPWSSRLRVLAVGLLAGAGITVAWQRYHVETMFQKARVLSASLRTAGVKPATRVTVSRAALPRLVSASRWMPHSWEAAITLGNLAVDAGDARLALESFGRALALAERPEVRFDVGMALLMTGDQEEGTVQLMRAVKLNPAIFREIRDPNVARSLRRRLDASGYGPRHAWMYNGTPAAGP